MVECHFTAVDDGHGVVDDGCRHNADVAAVAAVAAVGILVVAETFVGLLDLGSGLKVAASRRRH